MGLMGRDRTKPPQMKSGFCSALKDFYNRIGLSASPLCRYGRQTEHTYSSTQLSVSRTSNNDNSRWNVARPEESNEVPQDFDLLRVKTSSGESIT